MKTLVVETKGNKINFIERERISRIRYSNTIYEVPEIFMTRAKSKDSLISFECDMLIGRLLSNSRFGMTRAKCNKSAIMKRAWYMFKSGKCDSLSIAMKASWKIEKNHLATCLN